MEHGGIAPADTTGGQDLDGPAMMRFCGAIVAMAAYDYVKGYTARLTSGELPALDFLEAAGVLNRAAEIAQYSPMLAGRQRPAVSARVHAHAA